MKVKFTKYLHDDCQTDENAEMLEYKGLSPEDADFIASNRPWYEIGLTYEFDTETHEMELIGVEE